MLSKILVGVDGSQPAKKALEYASNLANKNNSKLFLVHVIEEFGGPMDAWKKHDSMLMNYFYLIEHSQHKYYYY